MADMDEKILALPVSKLTKMYDGIKDIGDMQPIQIERVKHFFTHYKDLEPASGPRSTAWAMSRMPARLFSTRSNAPSRQG